MDDTQQQTQTPQPQADGPLAQTTDAPVTDAMLSMNDVAGMTPPPAPVMPQLQADSAMPAAPAMDTPAAGKAADDDYSYAEDVLNEILDSLDRIEAKLDAMEKKQG